MMVLFLIFWGTSILFSIVTAAPIYITTNSALWSTFLHTLTYNLSVYKFNIHIQYVCYKFVICIHIVYKFNIHKHIDRSRLYELEKAVAPHSSTLAWKITWTQEPGGLQSMGSLGVGHDWAISLSCIGEGNGNPLQCSCLENPRDGGAWWAAVYGVAQNRTWLKRLSSSSSRLYEYI